MIPHSWFFTLKLASALGCGLVAGVFFAFSTFVMKALGQRPPDQGMAAMQAINITVINVWFMGALFGTAIACLGLGIATLLQGNSPGTGYLLGGSLLYLTGTILVTIVVHVPLNNALADTIPNSPEGTMLWSRYLASWTLWNHLRTVAALASAALFTLAIALDP